jgi:hypothetical protein
MRTLRRVSVVGGLVLLATLAFAGTGQAAQVENQIFIEEECRPGPLPPQGTTPSGCPGQSTKAPSKGKPAPLLLHIRSETQDDPNSGSIPGIPSKSQNAVIRLPQEKKVNLSRKLVPYCTAILAGTTTEQAAGPPPTGCGPSLIGRGTAQVTLPAGPGGAPVNFTGNVLVFALDANTILLHARFDALGTTTLIEGDASPSTVPGFGTQFNFHEQGSTTLPSVGPGGVGAISFFDAALFKKKKVKTKSGKKKVLSVFSGKCTDGTWASQEEISFSDRGPLTLNETQPCTQKKPKK